MLDSGFREVYALRGGFESWKKIGGRTEAK
jgi:rhodanese-related sulfurtransferase